MPDKQIRVAIFVVQQRIRFAASPQLGDLKPET